MSIHLSHATIMNFFLNGYIVCNDTFQGPGAVAFDFKEYCFDPTFYTCDDSERSFKRVMDTIKRLGIFERGIYWWYPKHYGPIIIDQIETKDFTQVENSQLPQEIDNLVNSIHEQYFTKDYKPIDRQLIKDKIHFSLRVVPLDKSIFFRYNVPIRSTNLESKKVVEHNLFSYFHSLIGYNQERLYLLTIFYE